MKRKKQIFFTVLHAKPTQKKKLSPARALRSSAPGCLRGLDLETIPLACRPTRASARPHSRPRLESGLGYCFTLGPCHSPVNHVHSIRSDGCEAISLEQNQTLCALGTLVPFLSFLLYTEHRWPMTECSEDRAKWCIGARQRDGGAAMSPLIGARAHQWVDAPPSSGFSAGPIIARPLLQSADRGLRFFMCGEQILAWR
jgi:hypothetical protein